MSANIKDLDEDYAEILRNYIQGGGETALDEGRELAQRALEQGCGTADMAALHHQALRRLGAECGVARDWHQAAGEFLATCLDPFEINRREAREVTSAMYRLNEDLEARLKSISRSLHDEAAQLLAGAHIAVAQIAAELEPRQRGRFDAIASLLDQAGTQLRQLVREACPNVLDHLGLVPALETLAASVTRRTGLRVYVNGDAGEPLPGAVETALYEMVQEAVSNAVKHAHAGSVRIELKRSPSQVACSVHDDGSGFDPRRRIHGPGLVGVRERLNALGGSLRVVSRARRGTTVSSDIPLGG